MISTSVNCGPEVIASSIWNISTNNGEMRERLGAVAGRILSFVLTPPRVVVDVETLSTMPLLCHRIDITRWPA